MFGFAHWVSQVTLPAISWGLSAGRTVLKLFVMLLSVTVLLSACSKDVRRHGYVPPPSDLEKVEVGVSTRDSVVETIGAPTSEGILDKSGFYYVSTTKRKYGFRAQETVRAELVLISFDARDRVSNVERYVTDGKKIVSIERRITDSGANNNTFLRQLLGNLTNFSPAVATGG